MRNQLNIWLAFKLVTISLLLSTAFIPQHHVYAATSWYVSSTGSDENDCLTPETACATIQSAIQKSSYGDTINILSGYYSTDTGEIFPINLQPGRQYIGSGINSTFLSGQNNAPVLFMGGGDNYYSDTVIRGLTVLNGDIGLHIYPAENYTASPTITGMEFIFNNVGIKMSTGNVYESGATISAVISDTLVHANNDTGIYLHAYGYFSPSFVNPTIQNSTIQNNGQNGIYVFSSAVGNNGTGASPHIIHSTISGNGSHGIYAMATYAGWSSPKIEESQLHENTGFGLYWELGINGGNNQTAITNTLVTSNLAGGIFIDRQSSCGNPCGLRIVNSNVQNNINYGIYWQRNNDSNDVSPLVVNSIIWNPDADDLYSTGIGWSTNEIRYSDVEDGDLAGQGGNFSINPDFVDNYHLSACSPAIDAGTTDFIPPTDIDGDPRPQGAGPDVGVDEQESSRLLTTDKQVSSSIAHLRDSLTYTMTITPEAIVEPISLVLSDTLPSALSIDPGSLWASQGVISRLGNTISWVGEVNQPDTISMGFTTDVIAANATINNYATLDVGLQCLYTTPIARTVIEPQRGFLTIVRKAQPGRGIYGTVTDGGNPAAGIWLDLRFFDGSSWSTIDYKPTEPDGSFSFTGVPALTPGQYYYVLFRNDGQIDHLWTWHTASIGTYFAGTPYYVGNFDIKDVHLEYPARDASIDTPITFYWIQRWESPTDSYEFNLYDPSDGDPYFFTDPPLGYVEEYTLQIKPPGFKQFDAYVWEIWIYSPDGGFGVSYEARVLYFNNKSGDMLPVDPLPISKDMTSMDVDLKR